MKVRELLVLVEAEGWPLVRQKGSRRQFHHPVNTGTVTVSVTLASMFHPARRAAC